MGRGMSVEELIHAVQEQVKQVPWLHTLGTPAVPGDFDAWTRAYTGYALPADLLALFRRTNGLALRNMRFGGEIVGTAFEVLTIAEVAPLDEAMGAGNGPRLAPRQWFAVGRASDGAFYVAFDLKSGEYRAVSPIEPDEAEVIGQSCADYLSFLARFLPERAELERLRETGEG